MSIHEKLERLTDDRFKTRVARKAGLTANALHAYLKRKQMPRADNALRLARALGVSVEWLIDDTQEWPPIRQEETCASAA